MIVIRVAAVLCVAAGIPGLLAAQTSGADEHAAAFLAAARSGTARYQDRDAAIADGYRPLGPDAPGMGQHWISPAMVLAGRFEPARPQILTYIMIGDRPVLAGVAYAIPTRGGEGAPDEPVGPSAWHYHGRTVDEESFLPDHHHAGEGPGPDTRVAVLHAWAWMANPAGAFEPDNWTLPFVRLGMTPPPGAGSDAGKALSLTSVGRPFYLKVLRDICGLDTSSAVAAAAVLDAKAAAIASWAASRRDRALTTDEGRWLEAQWVALWRDVAGSVSESLRARFAALSEAQSG